MDGSKIMAVLAAAACSMVLESAWAQDPPGRRASLFDLGIYGGGAWSSDWFTNDPSTNIAPDELFNYPTIWSGGIGIGARRSEISLPGVGTVQRGGQEVHILGPGTERLSGVEGRIGFSFKAAGNVSPTPASRVYFSYSYFEGDGNRAARVDPNTANVALTLDRPAALAGGGFTTGVFAGVLGADVRQQYDIDQHRFEAGVFTPFPAGPATFILKTGVTLQASHQNYQSSVSLVTLPDVSMAEVRTTDQQLFGPTIGGALQFPLFVDRTPGIPVQVVLLTIGGDITPLLGQTTFHSTQVINCIPCGPNFPVSTTSSGSNSDAVIDLSAFLRLAATMEARATMFGEVGVNRTERGAFIVPANPNEQPIRHELAEMIDTYVRGGISISFDPPPVLPPR